MTPEQRVDVITQLCAWELDKVTPANMEILKVAIIAQIKDAIAETLRLMLKKDPPLSSLSSQQRLLRVKERGK